MKEKVRNNYKGEKELEASKILSKSNPKDISENQKNVAQGSSEAVQTKQNSSEQKKGFPGKKLVYIFYSIRVKLFIGLLIPIVLLALYGAISYSKSENAIITNYENSSAATIKAVGDFLDFGSE
jgi:hypothetical protein